jgi:hypothetical protein
MQAEWQHGSLMDLVLLPLVPYLVWAIAYYIKVCHVSEALLLCRRSQAYTFGSLSLLPSSDDHQMWRAAQHVCVSAADLCGQLTKDPGSWV